MFVQRVVVPSSQFESWTVIGDEGAPVEPVERFLAFLSDVERSPNTVKAYAHDLKDWFCFLQHAGLEWDGIRLENVGEFVAWLRLPKAARSGQVTVLPSVTARVGEATINRKLAAVSAFYQHHARHGVDVAALLTAWQPAGRHGTAFKPFLHHISKSGPRQRPAIRLKSTRAQPRVLSGDEVQAILDACEHLRDRLLLAVLHQTGMRIGEALGLRHEDWQIPERQVRIIRRCNDNRARAKSARSRTVPVDASLVRLFADYLHGEYGDLDSDYVFVNLWAGPVGRPLSYPAVRDLVLRLRRATGIGFTLHEFRHTYAAGLLRSGVPIEVVSNLLGHASVTTTAGTYAHLTAVDARLALQRVGWFPDDGVQS